MENQFRKNDIVVIRGTDKPQYQIIGANMKTGIPYTKDESLYWACEYEDGKQVGGQRIQLKAADLDLVLNGEEPEV